jgi:hypothetical protein
MAKVEEQKFHYAIGKPWRGDEPHGSIGFYTYGSEIFYGTLNEAIGMRDSFNEKSKESYFGSDDASRGGYRIYQLSEVPNSEHMQKVDMPEKKRVRTPAFPKRHFTDEQIKAAVESALIQSPNTKKYRLKRRRPKYNMANKKDNNGN